jgi:hypothetical protein
MRYLPFLFSRNLWSEFLRAIGRSVTRGKIKPLSETVSELVRNPLRELRYLV